MYRLNDRNRLIGEMFSSIAPRYDLLNRLLSLGTDRRWRREAVAWIRPETGGVHLDVATGTADVALEIFRQKGNGAFVAGVDISAAMMRIGRGKAARAGLLGRLAFVLAPGEALPFRDGAFDSASVAFGIRNLADRERGLQEMCRVVRGGGRVVILEFSRPRSSLFGAAYRFYFTRVLPRLGGLFSKRSAYAYLPDSVHAFPDSESFARMMRDAGCSSVDVRPLTFGIVTLYVGTR
ncbi:MAG TPA: bifunctional demethylmenaquinone methyltransferase/2-methoxy-6-polyprenyl-1,4-benzoquinol methylase UbiE [Deltaproteobacteria bacterium]|nr:MAG: bifunctional demethylmenaquinone methyltransferase/2-methoxy-6-polyprenyl-1,4-benzoquinol methylase [Deltaproteobacteria bacterium GWC2_65_14]HBO70020.1 bifunctional demethylmenaquinone methyltransferase/2-methoxy-6-polyprenyl-1,4-benzoquinol methylase UbiE [Deltaproteobacteria bacterium]